MHVSAAPPPATRAGEDDRGGALLITTPPRHVTHRGAVQRRLIGTSLTGSPLMAARPLVKPLALDMRTANHTLQPTSLGTSRTRQGSSPATPSTPVGMPPSPAHRAAALAEAMASTRLVGRDAPSSSRADKRTQNSSKSDTRTLDRLTRRVEASESGMQRLEQRAAALTEDVAALNTAVRTNAEQQAHELGVVVELMESKCTVGELQQVEARLFSRLAEELSDIRAAHSSNVAALADVVCQDAAELSEWREWATKQLQSRGKQPTNARAAAANPSSSDEARLQKKLVAAEERVHTELVAAKERTREQLEAAEERMHTELEMFAMQFRFAAQTVEGNAQALDRQLQTSVSMLAQQIQEGASNASQHVEQLARHLKHSLEAGQQRAQMTRAELERLAAQLGEDRRDLKDILLLTAAMHHTPQSPTTASRSNAQTAMNAEVAELTSQRLASLLDRMDQRDHGMETVGRTATGTLGIAEGEPP